MIKINPADLDRTLDLHLGGILNWLEPRIDYAIHQLGGTPVVSPLNRIDRSTLSLAKVENRTRGAIKSRVKALKPGSWQAVLDALAYAKEKLEDLLVGPPGALWDVNKEFKKLIATHPGLTGNEANDVLKIVVRYSCFRDDSQGAWNGYKLAKRLGVPTCPYCNRQYTTTVAVSANGGINLKPGFDHYWPQRDHPLLAVSFYNLIPCCSLCNSPACKGSAEFTLKDHVHPYIEGFGDTGRFTFRLAPVPTDSSLSGLEPRIQIDLTTHPDQSDPDKEDRVIGNRDSFKIVEIYQTHSDVVSEILWRTDDYCPGYVAMLRSRLRGRLCRDDANRVVLGNYTKESDLHRRPLAKLTRDIASELGIL